MNQVVEQKDKINDEVDKNSRFLSAHNQKVIKQTKAALAGKFNNTAEGGHPDEGSKTRKKWLKKAKKYKKDVTDKASEYKDRKTFKIFSE